MSEYTLEDGRKAVKVENNIDSMTKVTEVYVEPKLEKKLTQRVIEKYGVVERVVETLDEKTGKVIDRVVEKVCENGKKQEVVKSASTKSPMQLVVEEKLKSKVDLKTYAFIAVVVIQLLVLGYVTLIM